LDPGSAGAAGSEVPVGAGGRMAGAQTTTVAHADPRITRPMFPNLFGDVPRPPGV